MSSLYSTTLLFHISYCYIIYLLLIHVSSSTSSSLLLASIINSSSAPPRRLVVSGGPLPATGRTREQVIARVSEQIPLLYYEEMPWELFTDDVVYANPYVKVPTKAKFNKMMQMIRASVAATKSNAELIIKKVEFIEPLKLRIDWDTTVCSPLVSVCVHLTGFDIQEYNEALYCYSHTENWLTPLPDFLFPFKTLKFNFNNIATIVPPRTT
eukprot:GHVS01056227.1.p1 GENE.GHVS01056227.1~~GHVS01056227.1.p1  ORF type:complete len:248 (-),score=73.65 GHVS01056227.1:529-1161(-)